MKRDENTFVYISEMEFKEFENKYFSKLAQISKMKTAQIITG